MFFISASIIAACCFTQTPKEWQDSQLDSIDRLAMEELISFAPPPIPTDATWILPKGEEAPGWSDFLGKVVVVQSWSNTDARSRQIVGATNKAIARTTAPEDVVFIMIHTPEGLGSLSKYQSKDSIQVSTIIDTTGELCNQFGFYTDPTNVVINRNGAVHYVGLGMKGLIDAVDILLAQQFNPENKTEPYDPQSKQIEIPVQYPAHTKNFGRAKKIGKVNRHHHFMLRSGYQHPLTFKTRFVLLSFGQHGVHPVENQYHTLMNTQNILENRLQS